MALTTPYAGGNTAYPLDAALAADAGAVTAITAFAGGGQGSATLLASNVNHVTTVATAADSVKLPPALPGMRAFVINGAATNSMNVFPATGETINALAANTAIAQAAGITAQYICPVAGKWFRLLSA